MIDPVTPHLKTHDQLQEDVRDILSRSVNRGRPIHAVIDHLRHRAPGPKSGRRYVLDMEPESFADLLSGLGFRIGRRHYGTYIHD